MFRKEKKYTLDVNTAGKMLDNVLSACDAPKCNIQFDKLVLRNKLNLFSENLLIIVATVLFIVSVVAPLFFPHSPIFISGDAKDYGHTISVDDHKLTLESFTISFDCSPLSISECKMVGNDGTEVYASDYDRESNTIVFPYVPQEYNIYIRDIDGCSIHLLLSPKK